MVIGLIQDDGKIKIQNNVQATVPGEYATIGTILDPP
jgi:hypothetical protein